MLSPLPDRGTYYRPTRAKQLRATAVRLARWAKLFRWLGVVIAAVLACVWIHEALLLWRSPRTELDLFLLFTAVSGTTFAVAGAASAALGVAVARFLERRASRLRAAAARLEAEHAARYGGEAAAELAGVR